MSTHSPSTPVEDVTPACPLWRRLFALTYDLLIVVAIVMVVGLACQLATGGELIRTGSHASVPPWYPLLQGAVIAAYFISSWRRGGQTLGMRPWRIRLVSADGGTVSLQQSLLRVLVVAAPLLVLALVPWTGLRTALWALLTAWAVWMAPALFDARRRALHDIAAGTELRRMA